MQAGRTTFIMLIYFHHMQITLLFNPCCNPLYPVFVFVCVFVLEFGFVSFLLSFGVLLFSALCALSCSGNRANLIIHTFARTHTHSRTLTLPRNIRFLFGAAQLQRPLAAFNLMATHKKAARSLSLSLLICSLCCHKDSGFQICFTSQLLF